MKKLLLLPFLAGCTLVAGSGDFEVRDASGDAGQDTQVPMDTAMPECMDDDECVVAGATSVCANGRCETTCLDGFGDCDGQRDNGCEVETSTSLDHCGGCGRTCDFDAATEVCEGGTCMFVECQEGRQDCDGNVDNGCEANLLSQARCGSCFRRCEGATPLCAPRGESFECVPDCVAPEEECEGTCANTQEDPMNCGSCGAADCPTYERAVATCEAGTCGFECDANRGDCNVDTSDGCETDLLMDVMHCGGCGRVCEGMNAASWRCDTGMCAPVLCEEGFDDCDGDPTNGCEVNLLSDAMNCGGCGPAFACDGECEAGYCDPIEDIDGQDNHVCARRRSGRLSCWGLNTQGQLGDGTLTPRATPTLVNNPESPSDPLFVRDVSVGRRFTCAIDLAGAIWCWGASSGGAIGQPLVLSTVPRRLQGDAAFMARTFVAIESRALASCAIDDEQHVWCWGENGVSQLGVGFVSAFEPPTRVANLDVPVVEIAKGDTHGCARLASAEVHCWGRNNRGQAGVGSTAQVSQAMNIGLTGITEISAGQSYTCAANAMGELFCWGVNDTGQFGDGAVGTQLSPSQTMMIGSVRGVTTGAAHTCAHVDGQPRCWGSGRNGELGDGNTPNISHTRVAPMGVGADAMLVALDTSTCAIEDGRLSCWGDNARGQLARETTIVQTSPVPVVGLSSITSMSIEAAHACAVAGGNAHCWGILGPAATGGHLGGAPPGAVPSQLFGNASAIHAVDIGTAAIRSGLPVGFGFNSGWRFDDGAITIRATPIPMLFAGMVDELELGDQFSCARSGGTVSCRGRDVHGQLGRGATVPDNADMGPAQPVAGVGDAAQLALGFRHACVRRTTGQLSCWGDNENGQLANGSTVDSNSVVDIPGLDDVLDVSTGRSHTCAIQRVVAGATSGQVICWGLNRSGQTGAAAFGLAVPPFSIVGLDDAEEVVAYANHSCALRSEAMAGAGKRVVCWGLNDNYELGDGSNTSSPIPVEVAGLTNAASLVGGRDAHSSCAILEDGTAACWGGCWDGVCGSGEMLVRPTPSLVQGLDR